MNYGHVGRPTNEEVTARKRKQILKIAIPVIAIVAIIGVIASNNGLNGLMGNGTCQLTCEDGWSLDGTKCYQENVATSEINAYLVGDVVNDSDELIPDGKVTLQDWEVIKNAIDNNETLTEEQELVYDLNGDGNVNESDVSSYSTSTSGEFNYSTKYVCPKQTVDEKMSNGTTNDDATKTITTVDYTLNGTKCSVKTTTRIEKKAACKQEVKTEKKPEVTPTPQPEQKQTQTPDDQSNKTSDSSLDTCTYDKANNKYICDFSKPFDKNVTDVTDVDDDLDEDDDINPIDQEMEYDEEAGDAVLNKTSNYLKYAANSSNEWKISVSNVDSETGMFAPISSSYYIYKDDKCSQSIGEASIDIIYEGNDVLSTRIYKDKYPSDPTLTKGAEIGPTVFIGNTYVYNQVNNNGSVTLSVKEKVNSSNYTIQNACQKITITKGQKNIPKIIYKVKASKYSTMKIDFGKPNSSKNGKISYKINKKTYYKIPAGSSYKVSIGKPKDAAQSKLLTGFKYNKKTYKLAGFNLMKGNSYLCYKTSKHDNQDFVWQKSCSHGRILFPATSTAELVYYLKTGGDYTLKAQWRTSNVVIKLKNAATKKAYQRYAKLQLYTTKDGCLKKNASLKFGKLYSQSSLNKSNTGIIKITNNLTVGKTYYLRMNISNFYNETTSPQCIVIKATTKNKDVLLVPKTFDVNYSDGTSAKDTMAPTKNKKTDQVITLKKNTYTKKDYKFDHWVASRKVTVNGKKVTQYKGFASSKAKNAKTYSWTTLDNCKKYGYKEYADGAKMNINTPEGNITMHAKWKKGKGSSSNTKKKSDSKKTVTKKTDETKALKENESKDIILIDTNDRIKVTVKFVKGANDATGTMTEQKIVKKPGDIFKLKGNNFKRNNYKFSFWVATRQHNGQQQYRCYKSKKDHSSKEWVTATEYSQVSDRVVKYSDKANYGLDTKEVTLHAHWVKK